jgi:hypothetical protein
LTHELGELKVKNLDDNTIEPFSLALPAPKNRARQTSVAANTSTHKSNISVSTMKRNNGARGKNNNIVTLDFADMLESRGKGSPHEYIKVEESKTPDGTQSPAGTSVQRTVEALKRISGGWSTPLASPLSGPVGYFDR